MAKTNTFNVATLFAATMQAVTVNDANAIDTIAAGAAVLNRASLAECVASFVTGEASERASRAGKLAAAGRAAELLAAKDIDTSDVSTTREALWPLFWAAAGGKGSPDKGETEASLAFYNRHYQAARRMAQAIAGVNASEAAAVRVPAAAMALAEQMIAFDAKVINAALKRARAKAKKAAK